MEVIKVWYRHPQLRSFRAEETLSATRSRKSVTLLRLLAWLNGLPMTSFKAAQRRRMAGSSELQLRSNAIAQQLQLIITRAEEFEDEHAYSFSECQVLCSIHILLRILLLTLLCHSSKWTIDLKETSISIGDVKSDWAHEDEGRMGELTFTRLLAEGWCKSELNGSGNSTMFFNYFVDRPRRNHTDCTDRCMASQTSEEDYQTRHIDDKCRCDFISADLRNSVSATHTKNCPFHNCDLSVTQDVDYAYIAISHVCECIYFRTGIIHSKPCQGADGLGNPYENSLPQCQLRRLEKFMCELSNALKLSQDRLTALWIDTLRIPVASRLREYCKLAI